MNETHIMLDLETMSTQPNAAIVAIGACVFDPYSLTRPTALFDAGVRLQSSVEAGLHVDPDTILWWLRQNEAARKKTFERESADLVAALCQFQAWANEQRGDIPGPLFMWGNGATFDNVVIRSAYRAVGLDPCWSFRNDRCYRTVAALVPDQGYERVGELHNAVDDAVTQAVYLQKVYKALGLHREGVQVIG